MVFERLYLGEQIWFPNPFSDQGDSMLTTLDPSPEANASRLDVARKLEAGLGTAQRQALGAWLKVAERGRVSRRDLKPENLGRSVQFITLVEILDEGTDYRPVIEGREVIRWFGKVGSNRFSEVYAKEYVARLRSFYLAVQLTGRPGARSFVIRSIEEEELAFSQLVLPTTDKRGVVRFLAIVFDFPDSLGRIPAAPLRMYAPWKRLDRGMSQDTILGDHKWR